MILKLLRALRERIGVIYEWCLLQEHKRDSNPDHKELINRARASHGFESRCLNLDLEDQEPVKAGNHVSFLEEMEKINQDIERESVCREWNNEPVPRGVWSYGPCGEYLESEEEERRCGLTELAQEAQDWGLYDNPRLQEGRARK